MKLRDKIFSDKPVNLDRQWELDLARSVIIFCLALIHCTIECTSDEGLVSGIPYLFDTIIGGPFSAPMYMFVMGIGMAYTKKNTPEHHFRRGLHIFVLGYILNICRFLIPYSIGYAITGDYAVYMEPLLYKVLCNDILTFAGLAMMLIALFMKIKLSGGMMLIITTIMCALGTVFNGVDVQNPLGNIFLGYLIGTEDAAGLVLSDFPLFNWMIFPTFGYAFAAVLKRVKDKKLFYLTVSLPAIIIAIVYFSYGITHEVGMFGEGQNCYYHMIFTDVLASLTLTVGMVGVNYLILQILPHKVFYIAWTISENITAVYFTHWVLVSLIVNVLIYIVRGTTELAPGIVMILGSAISIVSIIIGYYWNKCVNRRRVNAKTT